VPAPGQYALSGAEKARLGALGALVSSSTTWLEILHARDSPRGRLMSDGIIACATTTLPCSDFAWSSVEVPWPTPQDYNEAIQNPQQCFADSELRSGSPQLSPLGLPRPITRNFASVYRVHCAKRDWAVRCFWREFSDLQTRYSAISAHLAASRLPYTVGFEYLPRGISVKGLTTRPEMIQTCSLQLVQQLSGCHGCSKLSWCVPDNSLCFLKFDLAEVFRFQPHHVDDAERHRQSDSQHPGKVPHDFSFQ